MSETVEILEFQVGSVVYGIPVLTVSEILPYQELTAIPHTKDEVIGMFSSRGNVVTVIDLGLVLQHQLTGDSGHFIVMTCDDKHVAFQVNTVLGMKTVDSSDMVEPTDLISPKDTGIVTGILTDSDRLVSVLNYQKIAKMYNMTM